ncbi:hypothetical protein DICA2_C06700 [Diutina catenulata]
MFTAATLASLTACLDRIYSKNNLLVLDRELSPLINQLTPFSALKTHGKFDKLVWLDEVAASGTPLDQFASLIVVCAATPANAAAVGRLHRHRLHVVVANLAPAFVWQVNQAVHGGVREEDIILGLEGGGGGVGGVNGSGVSGGTSTNATSTNTTSTNQIGHHNNTKINPNNPNNPNNAKSTATTGTTGTTTGNTPTPTPAFIAVSAKCRLWQWRVYPWQPQHDVYTVVGGSVGDYVHNPLVQLEQVAAAVVDVVFPPSSALPELKINHRFAKGTHAAALVRMVDEVHLPQALARRLAPAATEFYTHHQVADTDLVVLDRALDWVPAVMDQVTYEGLIDDSFGLSYGVVGKGGQPGQAGQTGQPGQTGQASHGSHTHSAHSAHSQHPSAGGAGGASGASGGASAPGSSASSLPPSTVALPAEAQLPPDDPLLRHLRHLNFSSVGPRLNRVARALQEHQAAMRPDEWDVAQLRGVVASVGTWAQQQQSVKRHTAVSEQILAAMDREWLAFETEVFDDEYPAQAARVRQMLARQARWDRAVAAVVLVSVVNDGVRRRDWEQWRGDVADNWGAGAWGVVEALRRHGVVAVADEGDFLTTFTRGKDKPPEDVDRSSANLGITGAEPVAVRNYRLVEKFWNLHPEEEEGGDSGGSGGNGAGSGAGSGAGASGGNGGGSGGNGGGSGGNGGGSGGSGGNGGSGGGNGSGNGSGDGSGDGNATTPTAPTATTFTSVADVYSQPSFTLPSNTVPVLVRLVESLYSRRFLRYKPVTNVRRRPNWEGLGVASFWKGPVVDTGLALSSGAGDGHPVESPVTVVVVMGGVTRAELACFEWLRQRLGRRIVVVAPEIVNRERVFRAMAEV